MKSRIRVLAPAAGLLLVSCLRTHGAPSCALDCVWREAALRLRLMPGSAQACSRYMPMGCTSVLARAGLDNTNAARAEASLPALRTFAQAYPRQPT